MLACRHACMCLQERGACQAGGTHAHARTCTRPHTRTCPQARAREHARARTHTHTPAHTDTDTHCGKPFNEFFKDDDTPMKLSDCEKRREDWNDKCGITSAPPPTTTTTTASAAVAARLGILIVCRFQACGTRENVQRCGAHTRLRRCLQNWMQGDGKQRKQVLCRGTQQWWLGP